MFSFSVCISISPGSAQFGQPLGDNIISFAFVKVKLFSARVPPKSDEDSETFTPVHPDVMSAPEMEMVFKNCKTRLHEVTDTTFAGILVTLYLR